MKRAFSAGWVAVAVLCAAATTVGCQRKEQAAPAPAAAGGAVAEAPAATPATAKTEAAPKVEGPAEVARQVLKAFKAKDGPALAELVAPEERGGFTAAAPKLLAATKPNIEAMRKWDGKLLEVRYAWAAARVHFGPADGRLAVLEMNKGDDGHWYWAGVRYADAAEFAAWGSEDPNAPVPPCNGGGKHVDTRPLPAALASHGGVPTGAVRCAFENPDDNQFSFELGAGPDEAAKAWQAHLTANGFAVEDLPDADGTTLKATAEGVTLRVFTSAHVKNVGWTTVTIEAALE